MAVLESPVTKSRTIQFGTGKEVISSRLDTYVLKALPQDLLTVLRGVAMQELDEQVTGGNLPSQILVDGRSVTRRGIIEATRSVSMRFADTQTLIDAVKATYQVLLRVTRIEVPPQNAIVARRNFHLYLDGKPLGLLPGALAQLTPGKLTHKSVLRVVGPLVPYGRKLYWNPIGRAKVLDFMATVSASSGRETIHYDSALSPRFKPLHMRTIRRAANGMPGDKAANLSRLLKSRPGHVEGAGQIAKRVLRRDRRFAAIYFSDGWVEFPPAASWGKHSKDARVPSVSVQLAKKGGLQVLLASL